MKNTLIGISTAAGVSMVAFVVLLFFPIQPPQQYAIFLNPVIEKGNVGTEIHVTIKNIGRDALTNVKIDYGPGSKYDLIPILNPGEKITTSPSNVDESNGVTITTDQGVTVSKEYVSPIALPGMAGNGYGG
jgi:hypothetical protein